MGYDPLPLNFSIEYLLRCMIVFKGKKKKKMKRVSYKIKMGGNSLIIGIHCQHFVLPLSNPSPLLLII